MNKWGLIIKETKRKVLDFGTLRLDTIARLNRLAPRNPMLEGGGLHVSVNRESESIPRRFCLTAVLRGLRG